MPSILASFPTPPTHVPVPSPKYLSTFLVGTSKTNGDDLSFSANGNIVADRRSDSHAPSIHNTGASERFRSISSSSSSSSSSPQLTAAATGASFPSNPTTTSFPLSTPVSLSPSTSPTLSVCLGLGPPPTSPLPPLPPLPSPVTSGDQIAFVRGSYNGSSNSGSTRSLRSPSSIASMRSVNHISSQHMANTTPEKAVEKTDGSQSIRSLRSTVSIASLRSMRSDSSGTTSVGTRTGVISRSKGKYASSSVSEYEESILDVEFDFDDEDAADEDQLLIEKSPHSGLVSICTRDENGTHRHQDQDQIAFPMAVATSINIVASNDSSEIEKHWATRKISSSGAGGSSTGSSAPAVQIRSRTSSTQISSSTRSNSNSCSKGIKTSANSNLRLRTYSQPSSSKRKCNSSVPDSLPARYPATRIRAISSIDPKKDSVTNSISVKASASTASTFKLLSKSPSAHSLRSPVTHTQFIPPSLSQHSTPLPPTSMVEPTTPLTPSHVNYSELSFPSTPNPLSSDRSTSPDINTLLNYTSEVLKSGGRKTRSSSRPAGNRVGLSLSDRKRTSSMLSLGSKRSAGSAGSSAYESAKGGMSKSSRSPYVNANRDDGSPVRSIQFGSTGKQRQRPRLRSNSKGSMISKSSSANLATGLGHRLEEEEETAGLPIASSSRVSLMDESFDEDRKDVFQEDLDRDYRRGAEEDTYSFFKSSNSLNRPGEDDPTLSLSFPVMEDEDAEDMIDLKTPLPHLLLRAGVLSPHSKLLPRRVGSSDEDDDDERGRKKTSKGRTSPIGSVISSLTTTTTSSKHPRDARDTVKRRIRHKDGRLLRGGIGLTTGLGWSDSEDEDAPSEFTTRLKRLASMGGLSALSRKSSVVSNISGYGNAYPASQSNASYSGYGSVYERASTASLSGYAPSVSVSQSGSGGRMSTYTDASGSNEVPTSYYGGPRTNGTSAASSIISASVSSSRNVSRQSSFSVPYHHTPIHSSANSTRSDFGIVEEDIVVERDLTNATTSGYLFLTTSVSKDKERARKTSSMIRVDERAIRNADDGDDDHARGTRSTAVAPPSYSPQRNSTISVSSITSSSSSTHSNTITLQPPSIAGSLTPTPQTPTTPTPISSFGNVSSTESPLSSSQTHPNSQPSVPVSSTKQPARLNTNLSGMAGLTRSHSPVPPPSPAPTGPLPPTPGKMGLRERTVRGGFGASVLTHPPARTSGSGSSLEEHPATTATAAPTPQPPHSTVAQPQRVVSPTSSHPARVTSPTPSFSMPTGSRTIHPVRSRAGSLSSRETSYGTTSTRNKNSLGSIGSIGSLGNGTTMQEEKGGRLPYVVEDDDAGLAANQDFPSTGPFATVVAETSPDTEPVATPLLDEDALAIVETEPSEYGDGVAIVLTGDEENMTETQVQDPSANGFGTVRQEDKQTDISIDPARNSIPEYPYRFDIPPPSPVVSTKRVLASNHDTNNNTSMGSSGSFGFKRDRPAGERLQSSTTTSSSGSLAKYSVSVSSPSNTGSSIPSVAFSPSVTGFQQEHAYTPSVSSIDTSESTAFFAVARSDHMRMDSWNQSFSVFGSGMGVPPPDDVGINGIGEKGSNGTAANISTSSSHYDQPPLKSSVSSIVARAASPILAIRARAASPIATISSMRVGSSLGFASSSNLPSSSTTRPITPSSQLGLPVSSQSEKRGQAPAPPTTTSTASSKPPSAAVPITPAPRKSSLPLPPSLFSTPGRPTSPPPPSSTAGHMPSLLLRPAGGIPRKVGGGIARSSPSTPTTTSTSTSMAPNLPSPSSSSIPTKMVPSIPLRSSSATPQSMLPQPGRRVGTPVMRYGTPGIGSGKRST